MQLLATLTTTCVLSTIHTLAQPPVRAPAPPQLTLTVKVLLPNGRPAPGVEVAPVFSAPRDEPGFSLRSALDAATDLPKATDDSGSITFPENVFFYSPEDSRPRTAVGLSADRTLIGLTMVTRENLGRAVTIQLQPGCRVSVKLKSTSLEALGRPLANSHLYALWNDTRFMGSEHRPAVHELLLPPGDFKLSAYGRDTTFQITAITVKPGELTKIIDLDIPAAPIAHLLGKPAPELTQIKAWKNGGPVKLADLKGKVVLLDFWGQWCGPCVGSMPDLMELHDKYKDRGLVVIAVHDDSVASIEEMDALLADRKKSVWAGRDLPFLVALDGGGETLVPGSTETVRGATTAAYGIYIFPTQILIDRRGNVVGERAYGEKDQLPGLMEEK